MNRPQRRGGLIIAVFLIAIAATVIGWSRTLIYKESPPGKLALWFPVIVLTGVKDVEAVFVSFLQFPVFALAFSLAIQRFPVGRVLVVLLTLYAALAALAVAMWH